MMISAPLDKTIFVNPSYGSLSPAASHIGIDVSLEFFCNILWVYIPHYSRWWYIH